jgi:hypothetical protein
MLRIIFEIMMEIFMRHKIIFSFAIIVMALSFIVIAVNENMNIESNNYTSIEEKDLGNYFWMPSSIMQSAAAIYGLSIAVFILAIQYNQKDIRLLSKQLRPLFVFVSFVVAFTIYYNEFVLFILSYYKPIKLEVNILCFGSLISLPICIFATFFASYWMVSKVAGLKTPGEIILNLYRYKNMEKCNFELNTEKEK